MRTTDLSLDAVAIWSALIKPPIVRLTALLKKIYFQAKIELQ